MTPDNTIQKSLTSSDAVHTPGFFRAMQADYKAGSGHDRLLRRRAINAISEVYRISAEEATGILSGTIPVEMDEVAGTVTYTIAV